MQLVNKIFKPCVHASKDYAFGHLETNNVILKNAL